MTGVEDGRRSATNFQVSLFLFASWSTVLLIVGNSVRLNFVVAKNEIDALSKVQAIKVAAYLA